MFNSIFSQLTVVQIIALGICLSLILGILVYAWREWRWELGVGFASKFGVAPQYRGAQRIIDERLSELAVEYQGACENEALVLKMMVECEGISQIPSNIGSLPVMQLRVKFAKNRFWRAHSLAKHFGFKVEKKYKSYLPK